MRWLLNALVVLAVLGALLWWLSAPQPLPDSHFEGLTGDAGNGELVFWAAGCASCHSAEGARGDDRLVLAGGRRFESDFGTFVAPNISTDEAQGIGGWTLAEFGNAMLRGVSPSGEHYYPSFPYTAYIRMTLEDLADLKAYLETLPASSRANEPHELGFPFTVRRGLGFWKRLYLDEDWVVAGELTEQQVRGRYLSEALAHCGECHTPRDALGGMETSRWLAGAPNPSGRGSIPDITPGGLTWSERDIAGYLASGFTPTFDTAGGTMAAVVDALARLPSEDHAAIAAYLQAVPASE
ncbi:MAG: c-type cytochrome [Gammaproteobacteria bacterium]|nr:c-type cytochrome [Gammaproteobacteria bacterium]TVQ46825.1 MAG: diacylglycerol kinase [Gammaproteobacteria bacterium]